jgi:transcription antitermination protein NusB
MSRRELREQIFKLLFRVEFNQLDEMPQQCRYFFEDEDNAAKKVDEDYIQSKYEKIVEKISTIDDMINTKAEGWKTNRMSKVDLTLLRLAIYEIEFDDEVPTGVAINEAVELAKTFGQDESSSFVNGILAKFAN